VFYPLGFPVRIRTRSTEVIEAATVSWGSWHPLFEDEPLEFAVRVTEGPAASSSDFAYRPGVVEFVGDAANYGWFAPPHRRGCLHVTSETVRDVALFRYRFLEALVLTALDTVAFTPIHAACVSQGGRGVLLCGDSGVGKSSLAYACGKAGWTIVSDDAVHLVQGEIGRAVADPRRIWLRDTSRFLFPEIANLYAAEQPNGKTAIEIHASDLFPVSQTTTVRHAVFLRRGRDPARLRLFAGPEALTYFGRYVPWRTDDSAMADFRSAISGGCWTLEYSSLDGAIAVLGSLLRAIAA
jgi:hypothetical protein